jgi:hypothetical protein
MFVSSTTIRRVALVLAVAFVSACSPELVSRDQISVDASTSFPDAHDFFAPNMN